MATRSASLFLPQLAGELRKLFARQRTYIGFGAFLLLEVLLVFLLQIPKVKMALRHFIEMQGYVADEYFSGLTLALMTVGLTVSLLAPLYLALIAGDIVAKEVEDGTMRLILSRPVSRLRVVVVRYLAVVLYTAVLLLFIAGSTLAVGLLKQGVGGLFVFFPDHKILALHEFGPGLQRFAMAVPLMALSYMTVASLAFLFSCCNVKPAAATVICLSLYFIDFIFERIPYFSSIHQFFLSAHISTWMNIYRPIIPTMTMVEDYAYLLAANGTFFVLGALIFQRRDFKA